MKEKEKKKISHKERTGKTRVQVFLEGLKDVSPVLLDVAGTITGVGGLSVLADKIRSEGGGPEKGLGLTDLQAQIALKELDIDIQEMQELTKRLLSDNEHPITRLVRPLSYAFILLNLGFLMYFDGNVGDFQLEKEWIPMIKYLAGIQTMFYFGSRGAEKIMKLVNENK